VVTVLESKMLKLHTTRSWDFMDLERDGQILPDSIWKHAKFGQDVIIANLDSGKQRQSDDAFRFHRHTAVDLHPFELY
jgi:hypothetical protein